MFRDILEDVLEEYSDEVLEEELEEVLDEEVEDFEFSEEDLEEAIDEELIEHFAELFEGGFDPKSHDQVKLELKEYMSDLNEIVRFKVVRRKAPEKMRLKKRAIAKKKLGVRADTELFKRKFQYDKKKKRFMRRDKAISRGAFKKSNKMWRKLMKRRSHK